MREGALKYDDEQTCPDEALGDRRFLSVETVQIRVGLALLEEQLDLPAQAVQISDFDARELQPLEVGVQVNKCLLIAWAPLVKGHEPAAIRLRFRAPLDVQVDAAGREPFPAEQLAFDVPYGAATKVARLHDERPDGLVSSHDEEAARGLHFEEEPAMLVPSIFAQQAVAEGLGSPAQGAVG